MFRQDQVMAQGSASPDDAARLLATLPPGPGFVARPVLVVLVGLPGTGKTSFARRLAERFPLHLLESDALRRVLFPKPTYTQEESARLFRAIHQIIAVLLERGTPVLLDATNLVEAQREALYRIAEDAGARLALVQLQAPGAMVQKRLARRGVAPGSREHSDADWAVYQRMRETREPVQREHYTVDTSRDIGPVLEQVIEELEGWVQGGPCTQNISLE